MMLVYSHSGLMQTSCQLPAQRTQVTGMVIQCLCGITLESLSLLLNVMPNCLAYIHFCSAGEQPLWERGAVLSLLCYLELIIFCSSGLCFPPSPFMLPFSIDTDAFFLVQWLWLGGPSLSLHR